MLTYKIHLFRHGITRANLEGRYVGLSDYPLCQEGIDALKALAERLLERGLHHVRLCLPYSMGGMVDTLHSQAKVLSCRYEAEGILVEAIMDETLYGRLLPYVTG